MKRSSSDRADRRGGGGRCFHAARGSSSRRLVQASHQHFKHRAEGGGRGRAAGPALPTPRLPDGTVNFGRVPGEKGVWAVPYITNMAMRVVGPDGQLLPAIREQQAAARAGGAGARGGGGGGGGRGGSKSEPWMPWMPWSAAVYDYNSKNESKYDPEGYCLPPGGPRMMATPYQMEIIQQPEHKRIMMIFEGATHIWREIYMDGRAFPEGDALNPTYLGYSVGKWEGDTLVVENKGFNENSWLDYFGHPHTDQMHVIERWTRPNKGTLHYEATVTDPGAYTRPFTMAWDIPWREDGELPEDICQENNQYLNRLRRRSRSADFWPASAARTEAVERYSLGGRVRAVTVALRPRALAPARRTKRRVGAVRTSAQRAVERQVGSGGQPEAIAPRSALGRQRDHGCRESGR